MTDGLEEFEIPGVTSKGSHYHKAFYKYPRIVSTEQTGAIKACQILVEISAFGNPYPYERLRMQSFLTDFFESSGQRQLIEEYDMKSFVIPVLDKRRTLTEKLVSLVRSSLANDYIQQMSEKIRHFYDLYYLFEDADIKEYLKGGLFQSDFCSLLEEDRQRFDKPEGWQGRAVSESPLFANFQNTWRILKNVYAKELPDLAYLEIPSAVSIEKSVSEILSYL